MLKNQVVHEVRHADADAVRGEAVSSRHILESLEKVVPNALNWVMSIFPRGAVQIVQPAKVHASLLKSYHKDFHSDDRATWQAIRLNRPLTEREAWEGIAGGFEESRFYREFLAPAKLRYMAVAPLASPIFPGYPGAWGVYRTTEQGGFSAADLQHLSKLAKQYDQAVEASRATRLGKTPPALTWMRRPSARLFVFDGNLKPVLGESGMNSVDDRVREQMLRHARQTLGRVEGNPFSSDRICLPDARGDLWVFRAVTYAHFPALGEGPFVFYCMQPDCKEWGAIRPADLHADAELARLVPAMQFMHREFGRGPTLNEIAATVELSPFHFHRRFTELFGITPKHFLLECQIHSAKTHMAVGDEDLVQIANSCGFAHQSHFTSRFKQATGLTPTGWRKLADEMRLPTR
ncbi:MAG: AraC family transcriptional regulator [Tepidisphaeraceae bacterium]